MADPSLKVVGRTRSDVHAEDERRALDWLHRHAMDITADWSAPRTIKTLLARPLLPEEPTDGAIDAMRSALHLKEWNLTEVYRALYAFLTARKTKEIEVWRVEAAVLSCDGSWIPSCAVWRSKEEAEQKAYDCVRNGWKTVCVTGPHKQTIPAD